MQPNKIMYIDVADPLPKSYAPKKGEEMNRSTYSTMRYILHALYIYKKIEKVKEKEVKADEIM